VLEAENPYQPQASSKPVDVLSNIPAGKEICNGEGRITQSEQGTHYPTLNDKNKTKV
jgi:hypothetical protein